MKKKVIEAICRFETDCFWLERVYNSCRLSSLPEVRACLPELKAALDRFNNATFDKYFSSEVK